MANWKEFDEQLGKINEEHTRHESEIHQSFYSSKRAIVAVFEAALGSAAKAIEAVHPLYKSFDGLDATSKEVLYEVVRAFEKLESCADEQIRLLETRKPEVGQLEYGLIMPWLRGIEQRKVRLADDRRQAQQDASTLREEYESLYSRIDRLRDEISDLGRQKAKVIEKSIIARMFPGIDVDPAAKLLQTQIDEKGSEMYKLREDAQKAAEKLRTAPAAADAELQKREDDLQIQTERSEWYTPGTRKLYASIDRCAEELRKVKHEKMWRLVNEAKNLTGDAVGASRPPADRDGLATSLINLTIQGLTFYDKNVNGYLVNDGELVVAKLEKVYTVDGEVKLPNSVKGAFESLKTTLGGMEQETDEIGGYEHIPEWFTERREKLARGELREH